VFRRDMELVADEVGEGLPLDWSKEAPSPRTLNTSFGINRHANLHQTTAGAVNAYAVVKAGHRRLTPTRPHHN